MAVECTFIICIYVCVYVMFICVYFIKTYLVLMCTLDIIFYWFSLLFSLSFLSQSTNGLQSRSEKHWSSLSQESCRQTRSIVTVCIWERHFGWAGRVLSYHFDTWILTMSYTKLIAKKKKRKVLTFFKGKLEERCIWFLFLKLSDPSDLPRNAFRIFTILVEFLCIEHIDYALETGLAGKCIYLCYTSC